MIRSQLVPFAILLGFAHCFSPGGCDPVLAETAHGVVFVDSNGNGVRDPTEAGSPDILVSNQTTFTRTNAAGEYSIEVNDGDVVFAVKPSGFHFRVNEVQIPQFYYVHRPTGSLKPSLPTPISLGEKFKQGVGLSEPEPTYAGMDPTGPLPNSIDFGLIPGDATDTFKVTLVADPQPDSALELDHFRDDVASEMAVDPRVQRSAFGIGLGDLMSDHLDFFEPYNQIMAKLGLAWFNVIGNHDMNLDADTDDASDETWHRFYGPNYYAFFAGEVLFVTLDTMLWRLWTEKEVAAGTDDGKKGIWDPRYGERQLRWLSELLASHPKDRLLIILQHVPIIVGGSGLMQDRRELYQLLEGRKVLVLCGHLHAQEQAFIGEWDGYKGPGEIHQMTCATASGGWWKGIRDERGIPIATCMDGTENGYLILSVDGSDYRIEYQAAGKSSEFQMRVHSPAGTVDSSNREILVNVFAGSPKSRVTARVDGLPPFALDWFVGADPLIERLHKEDDGSVPNASVEPYGAVHHLWKGLLPEGLPPGLHQLTVEEVDQYGAVHHAAVLFEIRAE